jgi:hypothetical protein
MCTFLDNRTVRTSTGSPICPPRTWRTRNVGWYGVKSKSWPAHCVRFDSAHPGLNGRTVHHGCSEGHRTAPETRTK